MRLRLAIFQRWRLIQHHWKRLRPTKLQEEKELRLRLAILQRRRRLQHHRKRLRPTKPKLPQRRRHRRPKRKLVILLRRLVRPVCKWDTPFSSVTQEETDPNHTHTDTTPLLKIQEDVREIKKMLEARSEVETALAALVRDLEPISSIAKDVERPVVEVDEAKVICNPLLDWVGSLILGWGRMATIIW